MLQSPNDVVVGASDMDRAAAFCEIFGFRRTAVAQLPADVSRVLYGLDGATGEQLFEMPGAERGRIRLVATGNPPRNFAPFDERPFAIDLFSSDIEKSVVLATEHSYHCSPITDHHFGPVTIREVEVTGPDSLVVTLLENSAGRMSSILDADPDRLHSEVHAFVWSSTDLDRLLPFWQDHGLEKLMDAVLETPGLGALVGVPDEDVSIRLTVFADGKGLPIRVEFVEFLGKPSNPQASLPLAAGLHAPAFQVTDLEHARAQLASAEFGEDVSIDTVIHPNSKAATALSPGGQRFELWEVR